MAGYTRQSAGDIIAGAEVTAAPLAAEFNALQSAFNSTTGHTHDGTTAGNGPKINLTTSVTGRLPFANFVQVGNYKVLGNISGSTADAAEITVYDEDNMASNSATGLATQQSIKAYVDASTAAGQPLDPLLTSIAALTTAADQLIYSNGVNTVTTTAFTSTARSLLDDTSTSAMRTTLGLAIGTDVQAWDADLDRLATIGVGTAGYVLQTNGSTFSWVSPTATSLTKNFVASGTIASGAAVALKADGTVEAITGTYTDSSNGSSYTITENASGGAPEIRYDSVNNKVYVAYHSSNVITSIQVGTVSGTTITFGSAVTITWEANHNSALMALEIDTATGTFVMAMNGKWGGTTALYATAGTVSGTTITLGSPTATNSSGQAAFVKKTTSAWIVGGSTTLSNLNISAATLSGTTLTFGAIVTVQWDSTTAIDHTTFFAPRGGAIQGGDNMFISPSNILLIDGDKFYMSYHNNGGQVRAASISGTTITLGAAVATSGFTTDVTYPPYIELLTANTFIATRVNSTTLDLEAAICTVSGTTITINTWYTVSTARGPLGSWARPQAIKYDASTNVILFFFEVLATGDTVPTTFASLLTYSGTVITVQSVVPFTNYVPRITRDKVFIRSSTSDFVVVSALENYYGVLAYYSGSYTSTSLTMSSTPTTLRSDVHYSGISAANFSTTSQRAFLLQVSDSKYLYVFGSLFASTTTKIFLGNVYKESTNARYYIGVANSSVTNGQTVTVILNRPILQNQSGLTIRSTYYLNADGTIQTTANSRPFGTAVSTTDILLV